MTQNIESYPLHWPTGKPRTRRPERARFQTTIGRARDAIFYEIRLMGGKNIILSTNQKLRLDGLQYANGPRMEDEGAAVYFDYDGNQVCFACDRWDLLQDNLQAIAKTIEALRGVERWGTGDMVKAAFRGFAALPPPMEMSEKRHWGIVLDLDPNNADSEMIKTAYRRKCKIYHPDSGEIPDSDKMAELNRAYDEAKKDRGFQ